VAVVSAQPINRDLYTPTPIGYMLKSCVHRIPSGSHVTAEVDSKTGLHTGRQIVRLGSETGSLIRIVPRCVSTPELPMLYTGSVPKKHHHQSRHLLQFPPDYDGWEAYTVYNYAPGFDAMLNNFNVPAQPASDPDVLYLFPGLQNVDWIPKVDPEPSGPFDIIQPVLQYPGDDGDYWSVKSWYVTLESGYLVSGEIPLNVGDSIFGNQTRVDSTTWYIGSTRLSSGQTTAITAQASFLASQPWAYNTLECYGCTGCDTYPADSPATFTNIQLWSKGKLITPVWKVTPKPPEQKFCNELAVVDSPTAVHINF